MKTIAELIDGTHGLNQDLLAQLEQNRNMSSVDDIKLVSEDTVVVVSHYYDYSSGGGVARDSILTVFHKGMKKEQRWNYSDKWSHRNDRRDLMILEVGAVKDTYLPTGNGGKRFEITCIPPKEYRNRTVVVDFYY